MPFDNRSYSLHALLKLKVSHGIMNDIPPSGSWRGYYLYGHGGLKHRMNLNLTFMIDGRIEGEGADDIARFAIDGRFDCEASTATWTKAYVSMHTVEYSGIYCQRTICGDWYLGGATGGFWIWPHSLAESEFAGEQETVDEPLQLAESASRK
jgi:hypothetical protein